MAGDIELRRRRAIWRAAHRGTREMDLLLGRYAEARLEEMDEAALAEFELLLARPDPELQSWILDPMGRVDPLFAPLIARVRQFHGLEPDQRPRR